MEYAKGDLYRRAVSDRLTARFLVRSNYDKNNIAEAYVYLGDLDDEITNAYITIMCQEKNPDSDMKSGIESLASEEG